MWNCLNTLETKGAIAFLKNETIADCPHNTSHSYKEWCNGWRKALNWPEDLKQYLINSYGLKR